MENKEKQIDLSELLKAIYGEKKKIIKWACVGAIIGLVIALSLPRQYRTIIKIAPESSKNKSASSSLAGLAQMTGFDIGGNQRVDGVSEIIYPEIISSTPFLLDLASVTVNSDGNQMSFYNYICKEQKIPWWGYVLSLPSKTIGLLRGGGEDGKDSISIFRPSGQQQNYINKLRKLISVSIDRELGIIVIGTTMQDPTIAAVISDSILSNLQRYMLEYKTAKNRHDLEMNIKRYKDVQLKYNEADSLYAVAIDRNKNLTSQIAMVKLERLENEKSLAFSIYQQLATQVELSRTKLQENTPIATVIEPASVATRPSSPNRKLILFSFIFLGAFGAICSIVVFKR